MKISRAARPIRAELLWVSLIIIAVTIVLALGSTMYLTLRQEQRGLDRSLTNSAQVISRVPAVIQALSAGASNEALCAFLDEATAHISDIDAIVVADIHSVQYYYPDRNYIGTLYAGRDQARIFEGESRFTSNDTGLSGAERCAYAEVRGTDGVLLGFVVVGIYMRSVSAVILHTVVQYLVIAAVVGTLGALLSAKLSARIKETLMGYEPDVFLMLFHQREDILEALEEGVLAIGSDSRIMYLNRSAAQMFGIDRKKAAGRPLHQIYPASTLDQVVCTGKCAYNMNVESLRSVHILSDHMPIREDGKIVGAVAIFRNHTEVTRLAEDLTGVRHMVDAMRAYTHEFMNKLHVILGLLEIGEQARAKAYIMEITQTQRQSVGLIMEHIEDPSVAALLVGKTSRCAELGIRLIVDAGSRLTRGNDYLSADAYISILGNLIENAIDGLNQSAHGLKEITVSLREEAQGLFLCVEDTGPGIPAEAIAHIFRQGYSTKGKDRGTGLALVWEITALYHGDIRVESEPEVGTTFFLSFRADTGVVAERE